jgi:hypothetical protein
MDICLFIKMADFVGRNSPPVKNGDLVLSLRRSLLVCRGKLAVIRRDATSTAYKILVPPTQGCTTIYFVDTSPTVLVLMGLVYYICTVY